MNEPTTEGQKNAYDEGRAAFLAGKSINFNPFGKYLGYYGVFDQRKLKQYIRTWDQGWRDAEREAREAKQP